MHHVTYGYLLAWCRMKLSGGRATVTVPSMPDAGSEDISVDFEYEFERRSHMAYGKS